MQSVSTAFAERAKANMRKLDWRLFMSFAKEFDDDIDFFTIEESLIESGDFIKPEGSDVVQEWDKYIYQNLSHRVLSMEWSREIEPQSSISLAIADIVVKNEDDFFTPDGDSPIADNILPYRPIRMYSGFGKESIPVFIGLTERMPVIDEKSKTATFHCIDYLYSLLNRPLDETIILIDVRTDEALAEVFEAAGLLSTQYDFDGGYNIIRFFYVEKGTKLIDVARKLLEAESGRLYMDEIGIIKFKNRQNYESSAVYKFDAYTNIINTKKRTEDDIINVVIIKSTIREVQANQKYWELQSPVLVPANGSLEVWADFEDPVTDCDDPEYITSAATSLFTTNTQEDGEGDNDSTSVTLTNSELFAQSFKMTFENSSNIPLYLTSIELFATPAKVVKEIYVREQDDASVKKYDERVLEIENDFFQNESEAVSKAKIILDDFAEYGSIDEMEVKGTPALQLDDPVNVNLYDKVNDYRISKITCKLAKNPTKFQQILRTKKFTRRSYFTIQESSVEGGDGISP